MQKLIIKGKKDLSGNISISGSKNATLPILAACILANHVKLENIPFVKDIFPFLTCLLTKGFIIPFVRAFFFIHLSESTAIFFF